MELAPWMERHARSGSGSTFLLMLQAAKMCSMGCWDLHRARQRESQEGHVMQ